MNTFNEFDHFYSNGLIDGNDLLADYLKQLLEDYGSNPHRIAKAIGLTPDAVRKITAKETINPDRDTLLAIAVGLGATYEETETLLKYGGQSPLYARRKRDALVWFAIKKRMPFQDLEVFLIEHEYEPLVKARFQKE